MPEPLCKSAAESVPAVLARGHLYGWELAPLQAARVCVLLRRIRVPEQDDFRAAGYLSSFRGSGSLPEEGK